MQVNVAALFAIPSVYSGACLCTRWQGCRIERSDNVVVILESQIFGEDFDIGPGNS
jgi:hypothetical protein